MARSRNIKPGFFINDELAECEPLARLLFAGLWCIADREGRLEDRPKRIKAEILPYDDCDVDKFLNDLQEHGFIIRYEVDGNQYIQITNFKKHQNPHIKEAASIIPPPPNSEQEPAEELQAPVEELLEESLELEEHHTSTVQAPDKNNSFPADSLNLIPDSLNPSTSTTPLPPPGENCGGGDFKNSEKEPEGELESKEVGEVYDFYQNNFGTISPFIAQKIGDMVDTIGPAMVVEAMKIAITNGARRLNYVEAIIGRWVATNIRSPADIVQDEERHKQNTKNSDLDSFRNVKNISKPPDIKKLEEQFREVLG